MRDPLKVLSRRQQLGLNGKTDAEKKEVSATKGNGRGGGRGRGRGRGRKAAVNAQEDAVMQTDAQEGVAEEGKPSSKRPAPKAPATPERRRLFAEEGEPATKPDQSPPVKQTKKRAKQAAKAKAKSKALAPEANADGKPQESETALPQEGESAVASAGEPIREEGIPKKPSRSSKAAEKDGGEKEPKQPRTPGVVLQRSSMNAMIEAKKDPAAWHHVERLWKARYVPVSRSEFVQPFENWHLSMYWTTNRAGLLQKTPKGDKHICSFGGGHCLSVAMPLEAVRMYVRSQVSIRLNLVLKTHRHALHSCPI